MQMQATGDFASGMSAGGKIYERGEDGSPGSLPATFLKTPERSVSPTKKKEKIKLTKKDLRRQDIPLFDCVYCVENSRAVITGVLK